MWAWMGKGQLPHVTVGNVQAYRLHNRMTILQGFHQYPVFRLGEPGPTEVPSMPKATGPGSGWAASKAYPSWHSPLQGSGHPGIPGASMLIS